MKSWEATRWVRHLGAPVTRSEKLLLYTLADCHNEAMGDCACPSIETLAVQSCFSRRQTLRLLDSLAKKGLLRIDKHHSHVNRYFLNVEWRAERRAPASAAQAVDNSVRTVDGRCHDGTSNGTSEVTKSNPLGDTMMAPPRCHSCGTQSEVEIGKESQRAEPAQLLFHGRTRTWDPNDLWLKRLLDSPPCFFIPIGALDDAPWWDSVSRACGGLDQPFLESSLAKCKAYLYEHEEARPDTEGEWKTFVRRWLCRENEWLRERERKRA